jgi:7-carboxy-7-deazaguanine synthase (Cx14CxxC type)
MTYQVKEIFYTLQGEGANAGRPAVFCRFAGCNLWSGREDDRHRAACRFCDTDFVGTDGDGGGRFDDAISLADAIQAKWPARQVQGRFVVCTGGEPLLQLDAALIGQLHDRGFEVGVETNGTIDAPPGIDWLCVSPKAGTRLRQRHGHELKVVVPQEALALDELLSLDFQRFYLQPMDGPQLEANQRWAVERCLSSPRWRLSLQTHKLIGIR